VVAVVEEVAHMEVAVEQVVIENHQVQHLVVILYPH
jgi:hypothetical protein